MTQLTLEQQIRRAAAQNAQLMKTISETDWAVSAYQQSNNYITTLKRQIAGEESKVKGLALIVSSEYADHEKYRDSTMRRLAFKIRGKKEQFQEIATREEREWLDAVQMELRTKKGLGQLKRNLVEAEKTNAEIMNIAHVCGAANVEMDELYNQIFQGPTPDIPEEDGKESEVLKVQNDFNIVQLLLSAEKQALNILLDADKFLKRALNDLREAIDASTADLWGVGGTFVEMAESSALTRAQSHVSQVEMLISQAQRIQPAVCHIGGMQIAQQNFMTDVLFDNVFTDLNMRDKIRDSQNQLLQGQRRLVEELYAANARQKRAQEEVDQSKKVLDEKRKELQQIRSATFDRIAGEFPAQGMPCPSNYQVEPPLYEA